MLYEFLVRDRIDETLLEAEKARLISKVEASRENRTKRILTVFLCRVGLISAC